MSFNLWKSLEFCAFMSLGVSYGLILLHTWKNVIITCYHYVLLDLHTLHHLWRIFSIKSFIVWIPNMYLLQYICLLAWNILNYLAKSEDFVRKLRLLLKVFFFLSFNGFFDIKSFNDSSVPETPTFCVKVTLQF